MHEFKREGETFRFYWAEHSVEIVVDEVHRKSDDWWAWLAVRSRAPGVAPHLAEASHNLGAMQSRTTMARYLAEQYPGPAWNQLLEIACVSTVRAVKAGEPFAIIGGSGELTPPRYTLRPFVRDKQPTILFGDGGVGKSTLAVFSAALASGGLESVGIGAGDEPRPWLYLDWETDSSDIEWTLQALRRGHGLDLPDLHYRRETQPLAVTARQIQRYIVAEGIGGAVIDSLGAASAGDPQLSEVTLDLFRAVRSLGVGAFLVDHVTKRESDGKPFGSAYKHNYARLTFELRKQQLPEEGVTHIGIYNRKANRGRLMQPWGLALHFSENTIRFEREDIARVPELAAGLSAYKRIEQALLELAPLSVENIADVTGLKKDSIRVELNRHKELFVKVGQDWAVRSQGYD